MAKFERNEGEDDFAFAMRLRDEEHQAHRDLRHNFRGRRLRVCRAIDDLIECIEYMGEQPDAPSDQFDSKNNVGANLQPDFAVQLNGLPVITDREKDELKNMVVILQRMILLKNDGGVYSRPDIKGY